MIYEHAASYPPESVVHALGLFNAYGNTDVGSIEIGSYKADSLSSLNDYSEVSPQEIGEYLESVIMGGEDTPFKPIVLEDAELGVT